VKVGFYAFKKNEGTLSCLQYTRRLLLLPIS
jgi:hypothetical protein